jgi:hypothetical protein
MRITRVFFAVASSFAAASCASPPHFVDPGPTSVALAVPSAASAEAAALTAEIAADDTLTGDALIARRAISHDALPYDPMTAMNLDLVQASSFTMNATQQARFARDGMLVRDALRYPSFSYGYRDIYLEDLPIFISADSILEAVHRSYDAILEDLELEALRPELSALLGSMRERLQTDTSLPAGLRADVDLYLAVASALLDDTGARCVAGCSSSEAQHFVDLARAHAGEADVQIFGDARTEDFSQYEPRAHYADSPALGSYFRAMMWLGRVDMRLIETSSDGSTSFRRGQLEVALALRDLLDDAALARWQRIDGAISLFVGEHDAMTLPELDALRSALGVSDRSALDTISDERIAQAIVEGGFGTQRVASQIMINGTDHTLSLARSFAFFGQRYVVDSHVFSNVVYDRVGHGHVERLMPSTLDVVYAALGNDEAARLLQPELDAFPYAPDLEAMRVLVDAHDDAYWHEDLYTGWLAALRTLSPRAGSPDAGLPAIARTEPWSRRIVQTQLASWAELRHDTILYAKQSYTGGNACEFPDAYVEPYPAFFDAIATWAESGQLAVTMLGDIGELGVAAHDYFVRLGEVATMLGDMARAERTGTAFTAEQMAFVNMAVSTHGICGGPDGTVGWYGEIFFADYGSAEYDPTTADVHTQPTDAGGASVGRVLNVATGMPRAAIVTFETCTGPHAYVGLFSSYFERITENFERPNDEAWAADLSANGHPADPAFLGDLILR